MQRHKPKRPLESASCTGEFHQMKDNHSLHYLLASKLKQHGASDRLANFISRLNYDLTLVSSSKRIDVNDGEIWMLEKTQPIAQIGTLKREGSFIYDSRHFDEYANIARALFSELFIADYRRMITKQSILTSRELKIAKKLPEMFLPEFHYFIVKMNINAKVMEIGLFANDNTVIAMLTNQVKNSTVPFLKQKMEFMCTPS